MLKLRTTNGEETAKKTPPPSYLIEERLTRYILFISSLYKQARLACRASWNPSAPL